MALAFNRWDAKQTNMNCVAGDFIAGASSDELCFIMWSFKQLQLLDQKIWPALAASVSLSFLAGLLKVGQHRLLSVVLVALGGLLQSSAWAHGQHVLSRL